MKDRKTSVGFTLLELVIGVFVSALLTTGIVQLVTGSVSTYRLQIAQGQLEESSRFALDILHSHVSQAGYRPQPWLGAGDIPALTEENVNSDQDSGDRLGTQRWSQRDCFDIENSATDSNGLPAFYLLYSTMRVWTA